MHFTKVLKLISAVSLLSLAISSCSPITTSDSVTEQYQPDQIYKLLSGDISENISATGKLSSAAEVKIQGISDLPIKDIYVKKGDIVKKGDKLFSYNFEKIQNEIDELKKEYTSQSEYIEYQHSLSCRNLEQARSNGNTNIYQAQCDYNNAINERDSAYSDYNSIIDEINSNAEKVSQTEEEKAALEEKNAELHAKETAAKERISLSETAVTQTSRMLEAAKRESETSIQSIQDNLDAEKYDTSLSQLDKQIKEKEEKLISDTVLAPTDGIISELNISTEEMCHGESAIVITSCNKLFASVQVSRSDIYTVTPGSSAELITGNQNDAIAATVSRISHIAERDTDTFTVELSTDHEFDPNNVFLGMEVTAKICTQKKENIFKAPYTCIYTDNGQDYYVLKITENSDGINEPLRLPVQIGISNATEAEISSDELHNGDSLLIK